MAKTTIPDAGLWSSIAGQLNGMFDELYMPGYTIENVFTDTTTQSGAPIDTPKTVLFGTGSTSPNGIVSVDASGVFTQLKGGPLLVKQRVRLGRTGASGTSIAFFWAEVSLDGGSTWVVVGTSVSLELTSASETKVFFDFSPINFPAGTKFRARWARSSTGSDFGQLQPATPSAALQALGAPIAPTAQFTIYTLDSYTYV